MITDISKLTTGSVLSGIHLNPVRFGSLSDSEQEYRPHHPRKSNLITCSTSSGSLMSMICVLQCACNRIQAFGRDNAGDGLSREYPARRQTGALLH